MAQTDDPTHCRGPTASRPQTDDETAARRSRLQAGAESCLERVHELRDLVHDHLGPGRDVHDVLVRLAERRADRGSRGAGRSCARFVLHGRPLDGRADVALPDGRRPVLVGRTSSGGKGWSWMTGWFNIVGLVGIVASVGYGAAIFLYRHARASTSVSLFGMDFADSSQDPRGDVGSCSSSILVFYTVAEHLRRPDRSRCSTTSRSAGT